MSQWTGDVVVVSHSTMGFVGNGASVAKVEPLACRVHTRKAVEMRTTLTRLWLRLLLGPGLVPRLTDIRERLLALPEVIKGQQV